MNPKTENIKKMLGLIRGLLFRLVIKMLASRRIAFISAFAIVITIGLFYMAFLSFVLGRKEFEIGWLFIFSIIIGSLCVGISSFIMKKYSYLSINL